MFTIKYRPIYSTKYCWILYLDLKYIGLVFYSEELGYTFSDIRNTREIISNHIEKIENMCAESMLELYLEL